MPKAQPRTDPHALMAMLAEYADMDADVKALESERTAKRDDVIKAFKRLGVTSISFVFRGKSRKATLVEPTKVSLIDQEGLKKALKPAQRKAVFKTVEVYDPAEMQRLLDTGQIDAALIADFFDEKPIAPSVRLS